MQSYDELIDELAGLYGIIPEYWDVFGIRHVISGETQKTILKAMKLKLDSAEDVMHEIMDKRGRPWNRFIEPARVISINDQPLKIPVYIPVKEGEESRLSLSWSLEDEKGQRYEFMLSGDALAVSEQRWIDGARYIKVDLSDGVSRDLGYYFIHVSCKHPDDIFPGGKNFIQKASRLIITPDSCYIPPELEKGRTWGLSVNLYSIRSDRNWGVGDFTDLRDIIKMVAEHKGGFVGINPLHAIPNKKPYGISPYSPISRHYKNFIYLDMDSVPEVKESAEAQVIMKSGIFKKQLDELRSEDLIDYKKIAFLKKSILEEAFELFYGKYYRKGSERDNEFERYMLEEGAALESFALFLALWEHMNARLKVYVWQDWPGEYLNPRSEKVRDFRKENEREVLFYKYIQWLIDKQHGEAAGYAGNLGMPVGIYHDLAIGSIGGGSNAWSYQNLIAGEIDVGAPPDDFNPSGQNWNFPPMIPDRLKETGYEFFTDIIRKNMKYNGALRIDHALGMFRLFWIPCGMPPVMGTYVAYPEEDLLRIIALESVRNRTMVVAEDLGTVGANVRETLARFRMLSYRLLYFERNYPDPSFTPPEKYPDMALCAVTTHDLPTINGYWTGRDLEVKKRLDLFRDADLWQRFLSDRGRDKALLLKALKAEGIIPNEFPSDPAMTDELCRAIYHYLALAPCKLATVSLDDVIGTLDQQNMPGTTDAYPNWMQKTPLGLEQIARDKRFEALSEVFRRAKR